MAGSGSRPSANPPSSQKVPNEVQLVKIYSGTDPWAGLYLDVDAASLGRGQWQASNNIRGDKGSLRVRGGITKLNQTGVNLGTFRGSHDGYLNGTYEQLVAVYNATGTATRLYYGPDTAFTEFSTSGAASDRYGNTRLTNADVSFCICRDFADSTLAPFNGTAGRDLVVASDGVSVMVWDPVTGYTAKHEKIGAPSPGATGQEATFPKYLSMAVADVTASDSAAGHTVTTNSATVPSYGTTPSVKFTSGGGLVVNDYGQLDIATGATICEGSQVKILTFCSDTEIWHKVKLDIYNGTSWVTLFDPTSSTYEQPVVIPAEKSFKLNAFRVNPAVTSQSATYSKIRFIWKTSAPVADIDLYILGIYGGGTLPGGTSFKVSRTNSGSRSESRGQVCLDQTGRDVRHLGLQDIKNNVKLPISTSCLYSYRVTTDQPSNADRDKGVDYALVYALLPGTTDRKLVASSQTASWNAGTNAWDNASSRLAGEKYSIDVNSDVLFGRLAPDDYSLPIPPFKCSTFTGSRLFVGAGKSPDGGSQNVDTWFSELQHPFRFGETVRTIATGVADPFSFGRVTMAGQTPNAIRPLSAATSGSQPVVVLTEKDFWVIDGPDPYAMSFPRRVGPHGTLSPRSAVTYNDVLYWLDQNSQIMKFDGQIKRVSRKKYDTPLSAIPVARLPQVVACAAKDYCYWAYTINDGSSQNKTIAVLDVIGETFTRDIPALSITFGAFHVRQNVIRFWTEAGDLYSHDTGGTDDAGTPIPVSLSPAQVTLDMFTPVVFGDVAVVCSDNASGSLTATWTGRVLTSGTATKTTSIDVTTPMVYRKIGSSSLTSHFGIEDIAADLSITGNMLGNSKILAIYAYLKPGQPRPDAT